MDGDTLRRIEEQTGSSFKPDFYVRVSYKNVKEFPCISNDQLVSESKRAGK